MPREERRAPKTERNGKSQALREAKQLLHEMEAAFDGPEGGQVAQERFQSWVAEKVKQARSFCRVGR